MQGKHRDPDSDSTIGVFGHPRPSRHVKGFLLYLRQKRFDRQPEGRIAVFTSTSSKPHLALRQKPGDGCGGGI